jgi:hypothetical protein
MEKQELLQQIAEILRQDGEVKTDGECLDEVAALLKREEGIDVFGPQTPAHRTDTDPTPPHGTPRPKAYPCAWFGCGSYTAQPLSLCEWHTEFSDFANAVELLETWVADSADLDNKGDRYAVNTLEHCLNALHGAFIGWKCDDLGLIDTQMKKAARLFGYFACETCGDLTERLELDVNGLCENCREEAQHA